LNRQPIGIFDSGYGGLTVMKEIVRRLPGYDYVYLGDNARTPYGSRSFETVYEYTLEAVKWLFSRQCRLIILACNTASAKALRSIQQKDLPRLHPRRRVLGVIRPVTEIAGGFTKTGRIGLFATAGTVRSDSYAIEIRKFFPGVRLTQQACPMWVPLIENNEFDNRGADYFIRKYAESLLNHDPLVDSIILGCTHYSLIADRIEKCLPGGIRLINQGSIVAESLADYLRRHPETERELSKGGTEQFFTTDSAYDFDRLAGVFYGKGLAAERVDLD
jgi:glutamate racemase